MRPGTRGRVIRIVHFAPQATRSMDSDVAIYTSGHRLLVFPHGEVATGTHFAPPPRDSPLRRPRSAAVGRTPSSRRPPSRIALIRARDEKRLPAPAADDLWAETPTSSRSTIALHGARAHASRSSGTAASRAAGASAGYNYEFRTHGLRDAPGLA